MSANDILLTVLIGLMAILYSSIGHAGSSGYQASMALMGVPAAVMKPTALSLNVIVSLIGTIQFGCRGCIDWRRLLWLIAASVPAAYLGGYFQLPTGWYHLLVALVLWFAAVRLWRTATNRSTPTPSAAVRNDNDAETNTRRLHPSLLLLIGGILGLLSGLTGTGGGIFLTPLLVLTGWATPRQAAGLSAAFILANSPAGLLGWWSKQAGDVALPPLLPLWMALVAGCGWLGSWYGSKFGSPAALRRLLALVLVIAGAKMAMMASQ